MDNEVSNCFQLKFMEISRFLHSNPDISFQMSDFFDNLLILHSSSDRSFFIIRLNTVAEKDACYVSDEVKHKPACSVTDDR